LPGQRGSERSAGDAEGRLVGPAVPLAQLDRLPRVLGSARQRPFDLGRPPGRLRDFVAIYDRYGSISQVAFSLPVLRILARRSPRVRRFFDLTDGPD
jgi:hypothetical protein